MGEQMAFQHPDIDRGWAWVIVGAIFMYNFMVGGTFKSLGLFYVEFIHIFPEGPAKVGLIGLFLGISSLLLAPVGGVLADYVSSRVMALVGGVVIAASFSFTALARHLVVAILTFGCLAGATLGLIDGPILASFGWYFRRKRNIASGLAWTGSSVGNLVMAPLFSWMIGEYGIRGAVLLLGGIWLHTCVIGLLLRPIPKVNGHEIVEVKATEVNHTKDQVGTECIVTTEDDLVKVTEFVLETEETSAFLDTKKMINHPNKKGNATVDYQDLQEKPLLQKDLSVGNEKQSDHCNDLLSRSDYPYIQARNGGSLEEYIQARDGSSVKEHSQARNGSSLEEHNQTRDSNSIVKYSLPRDDSSIEESNQTRDNSSVKEYNHAIDNTSLEDYNQTRHASSLGKYNQAGNGSSLEEYNQKLPLAQIHRKQSETSVQETELCTDTKPNLGQSTCTTTNNTGYLCFLKNVRMWGTLFVVGCGFYGYYSPFLVIPLWAEELHIPKHQAALLISVIGLVEILSRVTIGVVIDTYKLPITWIWISSFVVVGVTGQVVAALSSFWSLLVYVCVHGLLGGVTHVVMAAIIGHVVSLDRMGSAMGLVVMQLNLAPAAANFTTGLIKELTGSYRYMLHLSSGVYLVGAALYALCPLVSGLVSKVRTKNFLKP